MIHGNSTRNHVLIFLYATEKKEYNKSIVLRTAETGGYVMPKQLTDNEKINVMKRIVAAEWEMFQQVNHIDGWADCQNDKLTFYFMRLSQFGEWSDPMLLCYEQDLIKAKEQERNLVMEKYAYMMETTDPEYYATRLAPFLPNVDAPTMQLIREICDYVVECELAFATRYPNLSRAGRPITAGGDAAEVTSVETYTMGELKTYSKETLEQYIQHIREQKAAGKNMVFAIKDALVKYQGYASLDEAERRTSQSPLS